MEPLEDKSSIMLDTGYEQTESLHADTSPMALSEIISADKSIAVWNRTADDTIEKYYAGIFNTLGLGVRGVYPIEDMTRLLEDSLPEHEGKEEAVSDIFLLADMLTCLFDCNTVGLRLVPLNSAMCPEFHIDNIPVRLLCTYLGSGTELLPQEALHTSPQDKTTSDFSKTNFGKFYRTHNIQQLNPFDVALLKGSAWPEQENMAAVHRSCKLAPNEQRVLLSLDPM